MNRREILRSTNALEEVLSESAASGMVAEGMGLISNLLHVGNELESRRVQPARRGIFLR